MMTIIFKFPAPTFMSDSLPPGVNDDMIRYEALLIFDTVRCAEIQ
jgi:hypothetical protein